MAPTSSQEKSINFIYDYQYGGNLFRWCSAPLLHLPTHGYCRSLLCLPMATAAQPLVAACCCCRVGACGWLCAASPPPHPRLWRSAADAGAHTVVACWTERNLKLCTHPTKPSSLLKTRLTPPLSAPTLTMKTAFALALTAAAVVAPQANAGICCATSLILGSTVTTNGYDCTAGSCGPPPQQWATCQLHAVNRVVAFF